MNKELIMLQNELWEQQELNEYLNDKIEKIEKS